MSDAYIGEIRMTGFDYAPEGWQICDGSLLSVNDYQALFALLNTTYGGNGQTTFAVPDLRGRVPVHQGQGAGLTNRVLGSTFGTETVTLNQSQLPAHTHNFVASTTAAVSTTPSASSVLATAVPDGSGAARVLYCPTSVPGNDFALDTLVLATEGGNQAHLNIMPSLVINYIICTTAGSYPTQS